MTTILVLAGLGLLLLILIVNVALLVPYGFRGERVAALHAPDTLAREGAGGREGARPAEQASASTAVAGAEPEATVPGRLASLADLAAGIAHEINNPLAIIVEEAGWMSDLLDEEALAKSPDVDEFRRALKQIQTQGARCRDITHNLLSFARRSSSKVQKVQLNDLVREIAKACEKKATSAKVSIETHLEEVLPEILASPSEIQGVLINLVNNAIDAVGAVGAGEAREATGGRVDIRSHAAQDAVIIEVADTGQGIPAANLDRIFDPFFTTKPVGRGTGLGLSICHGIITNMGGSIAVESTQGVGTTFRVRIPKERATKGVQVAPAAGEPFALEIAEMSEERMPAVLLVDDEVGFADTMAKRLVKRRFVVDTAESGEEALAKLQGATFDVVVMGVKMAGMDGITTLREIKAAWPLVEVILLSGHTTVESAIEGMKLGAFDYLLKPCDAVQLAARIENAAIKKQKQEQRILEARTRDITLRRV